MTHIGSYGNYDFHHTAEDIVTSSEPNQQTSRLLQVNVHTARFIRNIFLFLLAIEVVIVLADIFFNRMALIPSGAVQRFSNITREDGFGNWFSATQTLVAGVVLWVIFFSLRQTEERFGVHVWGWGLLACFFTLMGFDDATQLHERVGSAVDDLFPGDGSNEQTYTWHFTMGPFFVAMGFFILYFLWKENRTLRGRLFYLAALSLYGTAVVLDFIEGLKHSPYPYVAKLIGRDPDFVEHTSKVIEEFFEDLGTTFFLLTFLNKLCSLPITWVIRTDHKA